MSPQRRLVALCAGAALLVGAAQADGVVLASSEPTITRGSVIELDAKLVIGDGASVTILDDSGTVFSLSGPRQFRYPPDNETTALETQTGLARTIAGMLVKMDQEKRLGGVRNDSGRCATGMETEEWADIAAAWDEGCSRQAVAALEQQLAELP